MSQNFPNITGNTYIDVGVLGLQDRDNSVLTWFSGEEAPTSPIENQIWNDIHNNCIKWYHDSDWEIVIDYGVEYITLPRLIANYQPLNSNLTTYSSVSISGNGFISNEWIPLSSFFINNLWNGLKDNIGLDNLAYKSTLGAQEITDGSIELNKLSSSIITEVVFKTGDVIPSFNSGNKSSCVKLSKTPNVVFTVGASASNSTYSGSTYSNLFNFVWNKLNTQIYNSNGVLTSKGSNWESDWNNNKRLQLPCANIPSNNKPSEVTLNYGSGNFFITKSGWYELTIISGGGGGAGNSAGTWGHQSLCCGAAGAGFKGEILLNENDVITYNVGQGGHKGNAQTDWGQGVSQGGYGGDSEFIINGNAYITCSGGQGGKCYSTKGNRGNGWVRPLPSGGTVTVYVANSFNNTTIANGADGYGTSSGNVIQVNGPFNNEYGKGGSAQGFGDNRASILGDGGNGYFNLKFLAPREYGTTNSTVVNELDKLYDSITYFMKF